MHSFYKWLLKSSMLALGFLVRCFTWIPCQSFTHCSMAMACWCMFTVWLYTGGKHSLYLRSIIIHIRTSIQGHTYFKVLQFLNHVSSYIFCHALPFLYASDATYLKADITACKAHLCKRDFVEQATQSWNEVRTCVTMWFYIYIETNNDEGSVGNWCDFMPLCDGSECNLFVAHWHQTCRPCC